MQIGGGLFICKMQQQLVRYKMEQALNNEKTSFQKLILSLNEFEKGKINKDEIIFNGSMYDVKSIKILGDSVEMLAINDIKEENIIENIKKLVNANDLQNKDLPNQFVKLLTLVYISPTSNYNFLSQKKRQNIFKPLCEIIISHKSSISSPPPELV